MAHIDSISAAMFTSLAVTVGTVTPDQFATHVSDAANGDAVTLFNTVASLANATSGCTYFKNVKEFPAIGTPANIVKVPTYGSKTSKQVNGQADLNNMELTVNFIPGNWSDDKLNGFNELKIGDNKLHMFRFTLQAEAPQDFGSNADIKANSSLAAIQHSSYYFLGKLEAIEVTPSLTDAMTAKVTISIQSEIKGAYTFS
jgi:hypothetical protein